MNDLKNDLFLSLGCLGGTRSEGEESDWGGRIHA